MPGFIADPSSMILLVDKEGRLTHMSGGDEEFAEDSALLKALGSRDARLRDRAWAYLDARYSEKIRRSLTAQGASVEQAQDCVQEALRKATLAILAFKQQSSIKTWLWRIAKNNWIDSIRKENRRPRIVSSPENSDDDVLNAPDPSPNPEGETNTVMFFDCIDSALSEFSKDYPEYAKVIRDLIAGKPVSEIERFIGKSDGARRQDLSNIRQTFREYSAQCHDESVDE